MRTALPQSGQSPNQVSEATYETTPIIKRQPSFSSVPEIKDMERSEQIATSVYYFAMSLFGGSITVNAISATCYNFHPTVRAFFLITIPLTALFCAYALGELKQYENADLIKQYVSSS